MRVILAGDAKQHHSVLAGDALRVLEDPKRCNLTTAHLTSIHRQEEANYKAAIVFLKDGMAEEGFDALDALKWIHEISNDSRYDKVAEDFLAAAKDKKRAVVVCATWRECATATATEAIRNHLKTAGVLSTRQARLNVLHPLQLTQARLKQMRHYEPGRVVVFNRKNKLFDAGEPLRVKCVKDGFVVVKKSNGLDYLIDPAMGSDSIALFEEKPLDVAVGEKLLIRRNGKAANRKKLVNGELVTVKSISASGSITLSDGRSLGRNFRHFTHGYAVTSQNAQGKTVDRVIVAIDSLSASTIDSRHFYVAASRGRHSCTIYTDDKKRFRRAATRNEVRMSATEFEAEREAAQQAKKMSVTQQQHPYYEKTKQLTGTPGHQPFNPIPEPGQFAYSPGVYTPDLRDAMGGGDASQFGSLHLDPIPGNPQNPIPDEPGICGRPGTGWELPESSLYDSLNAELQTCVA